MNTSTNTITLSRSKPAESSPFAPQLALQSRRDWTTLLTLAIATLLAFAPTGRAVTPSETPELITAREEYLRSMQRVSIPVLTTYLKSLERLKVQYTREAKLEAALGVSNEIQLISAQFETAKKAAAGGAVGLQIVSASFGEHSQKRTLDVTKVIKEAFLSGKSTVRLDGREIAKSDPAPSVSKRTKITYIIDGERKEKAFDDRHNLNFREELK